MAEHDQEQNLCEECKVNEASCTVALMLGNKTVHRQLCQECMAKMGMSLAAGSIQKLLGALMGAAHHSEAEAPKEEAAESPKEDMAPQEQKICPRCGWTSKDLADRKHLGCPECYHTFSVFVDAVLKKCSPMQVHTGRRPLKTEAAQRSRALREEKQRLLEASVAAEDFETAARLRDELRAMADREGLG